MPDESTTPDLVELQKRLTAATNRGDVEAIVAFYAPDAVYDMSPVGMGVFEGQAAARGFIEDWWTSYEESEFEAEETLDLGNGVGFRMLIQKGRPVGSSGAVQLRYGTVSVWEDGKIARITNYTDIDDARAVAERLAQERGSAMSQENVRLVERAIAAINARDIEGYLACCTENVKLETPMAAVGGVYEGSDGIGRYFTDIEDAAPDFRIELDGVEEVDSKRVIAFMRTGGTGRSSGIRMAPPPLTNVYDLIDGQISHIRIFFDRREALKAAGLKE